MNIRMSRRALLAGSASLMALGGLGISRALAQEVRLRMMWWGTERRADLQKQVNAIYLKRNPGLTLDGESAAFNDYWPRLATQVAGGNAPDIINMDYRYMADYGQRKVLLPLDQYVGNGLDIADFGANLDGGKVDGVLYAINFGVNSAAILVNAAAFQEAGATVPHSGMTWKEYADAGEMVSKNTKRKDFYGISDGSGREPLFELWLRQRGKSLFTADAKLGYDADDATAWFEMWKDIRDRKACPPADIEALDLDTFETGMINTGYAATNFAFSSNLTGYQSLNKEKLTLVPPPVQEGDSKPGLYLKPSMLFAVSATSKFPKESIAYLNFLVKDPEATSIMGLERGVSVSPAVRANLAPKLSEGDAAMVDFIGSLPPEQLGALPPLPPKGAGEGTQILTRISQEIGFGSTAPDAGGKQLVDEIAAVLARG
ncbi:MAG TPA: ABC transporter substrate-binding protein [Devosiaceae bacterium]